MRRRLVIRGDPDRVRSSLSIGTSACLHGLLLSWLAVYAAVKPDAPAHSVYEQEIRPYEKHLVWYNLREKLPDVSPGRTVRRKELPRARLKFPQSVVAGAHDLPAPPQLIRMQAPSIELPKMLELPNVLAVAPAKPVRKFAAPPVAIQTTSSPAALPPAPEIPAPRTFAAPNIPRSFQPPSERVERPSPAPADASPPEPVLSARLAAPATLAIVGLNPTKAAEPPPGSHDAEFSAAPAVRPKGSNEIPVESAAITVPGLATRGGGKPASASLMSVFAPLARQAVAPDVRLASPAPPTGTRAAHVSSAPDPRLQGRYVYTVAIQMPNVTSYSGSWIVWFADRDPATRLVPADMRAPDPIRKVDPKYIQTAVEEGVQGVVRLAAVIRRDGRVEQVELLRHLDDRLDRSAEEALSKWEFEPARRDGVPVDVDAVFEIPFRLAPKSER